jgi:uncharacterized membrane protein
MRVLWSVNQAFNKLLSKIAFHIYLIRMNSTEPRFRIRSIDTIRGTIMIIMALDHVRDFFHISAFSADPLDPQSTTGVLFFTRWITHYCAPTFMLLSGISAYLAGQRRSAAETSSFLLKRGLWLVLMEIVVMTFFLSFDLTYQTIFLAVFWALGTSMITLGLAVRFFSPRTVLVIGLLLVLGHNMLDYVKVPENSSLDIILSIFLTGNGRFYPMGGVTLAFLYVILPWAGIMLAGYGLGELFRSSVALEKRRKVLITSGFVAIVLFLILRFVNKYGDPAPWTVHETGFQTFLSFLNVTKYPPSLLFTLVTQGPVLILLALTERVESQWTRIVTVYGKVPFFYFTVHFLIIHICCAVAVLASGYSWAQAMDPKLIFKFRPFEFGYELGWVYLIWIFLVALLYLPSKWYGQYKERERKWWLSYL